MCGREQPPPSNLTQQTHARPGGGRPLWQRILLTAWKAQLTSYQTQLTLGQAGEGLLQEQRKDGGVRLRLVVGNQHHVLAWKGTRKGIESK